MAEFPALPLFTDAFMADTMHLTAAQTGAYLMLLMVAWRTSDCALPDDNKLLARYARMDQRTWNANKEIILSFWKKDGAGKLYQARLVDERKNVAEKRSKNVAAGKASALKRHNTRSTPVQPEVNVIPTIPKPEPDKKEDADAYAHARDPESVFARGERIAEITGWKDDPRWMGNYSRLQVWLDTGHDFELDILPTVKRVMAKKTGPPPSSLAYFEKAIADAKAQRLKPMPKGNENAATSHHRASPADALASGFDRALAIHQVQERRGHERGMGPAEEGHGGAGDGCAGLLPGS